VRERELEATMVKFGSGQADVLVSTAIIESGLDIPASNTIIVNRADRFGLAQLYQLRGRVGRERQQAYCYLLVPADGRVDEQAQRRLRALQELTELGSGFKLALRDLEIRGAGNLLGAQQHGHIAAVGFDLYSKLLTEAVRELRGEPAATTVEPVVSVDVEGFLPEDYVPEVNQRLALYKRLAGAQADAEVADLRAELSDRFGPLPQPAQQLLDIVRIRVAARALGIERIEAGEGRALVTFSPATPIEPQRLVGAIQRSRGRLLMKREVTLEATIHRGEWPVAPAAAGVAGRIVAAVNNAAITLGELQETIAGYRQENRGAVSVTDEELIQQFLTRIIENRLQLQEAEREKIVVEDVEVDEELTERMKRFGAKTKEDLEAMVKAQGLSVEAVKKKVRDAVRVSKIIRRKVTLRVSVTEDEIDRYLTANREKLETGLSYHARHILLTPPANLDAAWEAARIRADMIRVQILEGTDFEDLHPDHVGEIGRAHA